MQVFQAHIEALNIEEFSLVKALRPYDLNTEDLTKEREIVHVLRLGILSGWDRPTKYDIFNEVDLLGRAPSILALLLGYKRLFRLLISQPETDTEVIDDFDRNVVSYALAQEDSFYLKLLIRTGALHHTSHSRMQHKADTVLEYLLSQAPVPVDLLQLVLEQSDASCAITVGCNQTVFHRLATLPASSAQLKCAELAVSRIDTFMRWRFLSAKDAYGDTCLHLCCRNNLPELLSYYLQLAQDYLLGQEMPSPILEVNLHWLLHRQNDHHFTPMLECCKNHQQLFSAKKTSRKNCAQVLLEFGAEAGYFSPALETTPLQFCLKDDICSGSQEDVACLLLEQGARDPEPAREDYSLLSSAILCGASRVVDKLLQEEAFEVNDVLADCAFKPFEIACIRFLENASLEKELISDTKTMEILVKHGAAVIPILFELLKFIHKAEAKLLVKTLLAFGTDLNAHPTHKLPYAWKLAIFGEPTLLKTAVDHGAMFRFSLHSSLCDVENERAHRISTFPVVLDTGFEPQICEICSHMMKDSEYKSCHNTSCCYSICEKCFYFQRFKTEDPIQITKRLQDVQVHNFVISSTSAVGTRLAAIGLHDHIDLFRAGMFSSLEACKHLKRSHLHQMGITSSSEQCQILKALHAMP